MRTGIASLVVVGCMAGAAHAQPGMTAPAPPPPAQAAPVPPPYAYQPGPRRVVLSTDDADLLERGEVSDAAWIGGGLAAMFIGFGVGQAIQGRWGDDGWIFTLGEPVAVTVMTVGAVEVLTDCVDKCAQTSDRGAWMLVGGLLGFVGLRAWETLDAFVRPPADNRRLHELRERLGLPPTPGGYSLRPYLAPARGSAGGGVAGVMLSF